MASDRLAPAFEAVQRAVEPLGARLESLADGSIIALLVYRAANGRSLSRH